MHVCIHRVGAAGWGAWCLLLLIVCTSGCSGGTPERLFPVTGTVQVGDQVHTGGGTVQFEMMEIGRSGKRYTSASTIDEQGRFRLLTFGEPGAPAGKHRVWVIPDFARMPDKIGVSTVALTPIPRKYMMPTTTDLEVEVKPAENDLLIEIPAAE